MRCTLLHADPWDVSIAIAIAQRLDIYLGALLCAGTIGVFIAPMVAWFIARLPVYYYRYQNRLPP